MKRGFFVGVFFIVVSYSSGQELKLKVSELSFNSDFERKAVEDFEAKNPDYFALLIALDETVNQEQYMKWKTSFEKELSSLKPELETKKKNDKKMKFLYEKIHGQFLTKYEATNIFSQVFKDGVYNCVSATGLYSLAFDYYTIPYSIQERPTHVYLVAYPEQERIQIETTTPIGGYYVFDQTFKQNYVKKLTDYKLISAVEYQTKSVDDLFDKHFFNNESIDITKLVGIQYLNSGLFYVDKRENEKAYRQFEKAYFFYPSEKSRYLMFNILVDVFKGINYSDEKKVTYLAKLCHYSKEGINSDMIVSEFYRITQTVFLQDGNKEKYDRMYTIIQESVSDKEIRNQISYVYHYENARIFYNQGRHTEAQPFLEKALIAKPNNVEMTGLFIANLERLEPVNKEKSNYITKLQHYIDSFPTLKDNNNFTLLLAKNMLDVSSASYEKGNLKDGESYRLMFEALLSNKTNFNTNMIDFQIGKAYSAACMHYFKVGQKSKAKTILDKGLDYAPNNYQLRSRREVLGR